MSLPVAVLGKGFAALNTVAALVRDGQSVVWIGGLSSRFLQPLPSLERGRATEVLQSLCREFEVETGDLIQGSHLREFRNKVFRQPLWENAPDRDSKEEVRAESLWGGERLFAPLFESRFEVDLYEIDEKLRSILIEHPQVKVWDGVPVTAVENVQEGVALRFASGEEKTFSKVWMACSLQELREIQGLSPLTVDGKKTSWSEFFRDFQPVGAVQLIFTHRIPVQPDSMEGFFTALTKDAGETEERHVLGYLSYSGQKSIWTVFLGAEESEDNHQIAKKIRRVKQALNKMFTGSEWLPEGCTEFVDTLQNEAVTFSEAVGIQAGIALSDIETDVSNVFLLVDALGPSQNLERLGKEFQISVSEESETLTPSASETQV